MTIPDDVAEVMKEILTKKGYSPEIVILPGSSILKLRPDLVGDVDPDKVYVVTRNQILEYDEIA